MNGMRRVYPVTSLVVVLAVLWAVHAPRSSQPERAIAQQPDPVVVRPVPPDPIPLGDRIPARLELFGAAMSIVGPDKVDPGDLVSMTIDGAPPGCEVNWILGNSTKSIQPLYDRDGRPYCFFATGRAGGYNFFAVVAYLDAGKLKQATLVKMVTVGTAPDKPDGPDNPDPGAAAKAWADALRAPAQATKLTKAEATGFADAFGQCATGSYTNVRELSSATSQLYFAAVGLDRVPALLPVRQEIVNQLAKMKVEPTDLAATQAQWANIAAGFKLLATELP